MPLDFDHLVEIVRVMQMFSLQKVTSFKQLKNMVPLGGGGFGIVVKCCVDFEEPLDEKHPQVLDLDYFAHAMRKPSVAVKMIYNYSKTSSLVQQDGEKDYRTLAGLPFHRNIVVVLANLGLMQLTKEMVNMLPHDLQELCTCYNTEMKYII